MSVTEEGICSSPQLALPSFLSSLQPGPQAGPLWQMDGLPAVYNHRRLHGPRQGNFVSPSSLFLTFQDLTKLFLPPATAPLPSLLQLNPWKPLLLPFVSFLTYLLYGIWLSLGNSSHCVILYIEATNESLLFVEKYPNLFDRLPGPCIARALCLPPLPYIIASDILTKLHNLLKRHILSYLCFFLHCSFAVEYIILSSPLGQLLLRFTSQVRIHLKSLP